MPRGITIYRSEQETVTNPDFAEGFRIVLRADDPLNMPKEIFLFRKELVNPETGAAADSFLGVCSPLDLSRYPANAPDPSRPRPFFRKSEADVIVANQHDAQKFWQSVSQEVQDLIDQLNLMDVLAPAVSVRFGD